MVQKDGTQHLLATVTLDAIKIGKSHHASFAFGVGLRPHYGATRRCNTSTNYLLICAFTTLNTHAGIRETELRPRHRVATRIVNMGVAL
jgi:hypothetical protein